MVRFPLILNGKKIDNFDGLKELAERDDAQALFWLGECMLNGEHTRKDATKAVISYKLSAIQGNAASLGKLGQLYQNGISVRRNKMGALSLMRASYAAGKQTSLTQYAIMLIESETEKDQGFMFLKYAMDLGDDDADYYISEYYPEALEVENNIDISEELKEIWLKSGICDLVEIIADEFETLYLFMGSLEKGTDLYNFYAKFYEITASMYPENSVQLKDIIYYEEEQEVLESDEISEEIELEISSEKKQKHDLGKDAGTSLGVVSNVGIMYGMDKFGTPRGHGFVAERANHINDCLRGRKAIIVGDNNEKWGADRLVNGVAIQSKYCQTGAKCIAECFSDEGFKYWNADGTPMLIEVPPEQYSKAVAALERRIVNGELRGNVNGQEVRIDDPGKAKDFVKKGSVTYEQAKNIAKAGTVESLVYDAANGMVIAAGVLGVSATISFASSIWNGEDIDEALKIAIATGLKAAGTAFISTIVTSQVKRMISHTTLDVVLTNATNALSEWVGPNASKLYLRAMHGGINIYGTDAMKQVSKIFKDEIISGTVTTVILSAGDISDLFRGRISEGQFVKNVSGTAASVAGASVGRTVGAAIGSVVPVVGSFIGGVVGGAIGGMVAREAVTGVLDEYIEDDSVEMMRILEKNMKKCARDYMLNQNEAEVVIDEMQDYINENFLKDMYQSRSRNKFAYEFISQFCEDVTANRIRILMPKQNDMARSVKEMLEDITSEYEEKYMAVAS